MNRNIRKSEVKKGMTGKLTPDQVDDVMKEPDAFFECLKNREGGEMPSISLYFNEAGQFVDNPTKNLRIREIDE